ncbi:hypothetical protein ACTXT7_017359 [Hymenolepis weldensis]
MTTPDNATPHTSRATKNLVEENGWENRLMGQRFTSKEEVEVKKLVPFFESKVAKFSEEGMRKLMARWGDVVNKNGDYVEH